MIYKVKERDTGTPTVQIMQGFELKDSAGLLVLCSQNHFGFFSWKRITFSSRCV